SASSSPRRIFQRKHASNRSLSIERCTANRCDDQTHFGCEKRRNWFGESSGKACSIGRHPSRNGSSAGNSIFRKIASIVILTVRDETKLLSFGKANRARNAPSLISIYIVKSVISPTCLSEIKFGKAIALSFIFLRSLGAQLRCLHAPGSSRSILSFSVDS